MDKLKGVAHGGWHPSKDGMGKKTSLRGDFKGVNQVAGWMGKGKDTSGYKAEDHQSTPLSALKDPDSFGPPPVRRGTGDPYAPPSAAARTTHTGGLGAPVQTGTIHGQESRLERERREAREAEEEEERRARAPPVPFRTDTTGLSTANLPPPPKRGDAGSPASPVAGRPKPSLPPRLPPRGAAADAMPPPPYSDHAPAHPDQGVLNQGALNRLGQAGVNVPGLGIGANDNSTAPPSLPARGHDPPAASPQAQVSPLGHGGQMSELQQRFAKMNTSRHEATPAEASSPAGQTPSSPVGKRAPPPPPPKKKELHSTQAGDFEAPPPIPMSSKPGLG